jgi:LytTr DNA-binding domain
MQLTMRELHRHPIVRHLAVAIGIGTAFGYFGPFGSYPAFDRVTRYGFWIGLAGFGYANAALLAGMLARSAWAARLAAPSRLAIVAAGSAVPTTLATAWILGLVQPGRDSSPSAVAGLYVAVSAVQAVLAFVHARVAETSHRTPATRRQEGADPRAAAVAVETPARPSPAAAPPAFMKRVPARYGTELLAIESDDHYLRVHTALGAYLMHFRIADALVQLESADGLQVHRRWWVARHAVLGIERDGARTFLRLSTNLRVPVSRTHLPAVKSTRWPAVPVAT